MLCKNQHSLTKNKKPPLQASPSLHNLLHPPKSPSQSQTPATKKKHDNPQILPPPLLPLSPPNSQRKGERLSSLQLLHRLSRFQRPTHQSTLVSRCPSRFTDSRSDFSRTHHISRSRRRRREKRTRQKVYYSTTTSSSFYRSRSENGVRIFLLFLLFSPALFLFFSPFFYPSFLGKPNRWKNPHNVFRTQWNIHNVPVLVRYELVAVAVEGNTTTTKQVKEVGRLVEGEILDERRLQELVYG